MIDGPNKPGSPGRLLELARLAASKPTERAAAAAEKTAGQAASGTASRDLGMLRARLRRQVEGLELDDPDAVMRCRKGVLREMLAWEFGDAIRNHPEFGVMVDAIESVMSRHPGSSEKFQELLRNLRDE